MTKSLIKKDGIIFSEEEIADIMIDNAKEQINHLLKIKNELTILEPSVGDGSLIIKLLEYIPNSIKVKVECLDIHEKFLKKMKENILLKDNVQINYLNQDYLEYISGKKYDIIIANPPYVRTAIMGGNKSKSLKKQFGLSGKIDLYHAFLIKMISELSEIGLLIVITSNKYLYNKTGEVLRQQIIGNLLIDVLIDLGDTKLFDAAVLPAILIGTKNNSAETRNYFISIYEEYSKDISIIKEEYSTIRDAILYIKGEYFIYKERVFRCKKGLLEYKNNDLLLLSKKEQEFIQSIEANSMFVLKEIASVKVGIKTTADKVFISKDIPVNIEEDLVHPIIVSKAIQKWKVISKNKKYIIYPYKYQMDQKQVIVLEEYPKCKKYFQQHSKVLKNRSYIMKSKKKWFEIWVPHHPKLWKLEKIVFKDISSHGTFAFDKGSIVNGDSFFIILKDGVSKDYLYFLLGLLNSEIIAKYHDLRFPNKLYSNKKRFNSQYVEKYPIPNINTKASQEIIKIVKQIIHKNVEVELLENKLNILCKKAYSLT